MTTSTTFFRQNMNSILEEYKNKRKTFKIWRRNKEEFLVVPFSILEDSSDLFSFQEKIEDSLIQKEYYQNLENLNNDWLDEDHDDIFEV